MIAGKVPEWRRKIAFTPAAVTRLAGIDVPKAEIVRILMNLGFTGDDGDPMQVVPP